MKRHYLFFIGLLFSISLFSQTTLIDSLGDGGFNNGTTFAANGWTRVNGAVTNKFYLGTVPTGTSFTSSAAYISNAVDSSTWNYLITSTSVVHFYRDITIPTGETNVNLKFKWSCLGEVGSYDALMVSYAPTSYTPTASTTSLTTTGLLTPAVTFGQFWNSAAYNSANLSIPSAAFCNGNTIRLIFTWKNDGSGGSQPPIAIDNIHVISGLSADRITTAGGTFTIDNSLPNAGVNFTTFSQVINEMNALCVPPSSLIFNVAAGQVFTENTPPITQTGSATSTIIFQKSGSGANPKIVAIGSAGTSDFGICISGGDYITFDGIDIGNTSANAVEFGYLIRNASATNGANNNTIKNTSISLSRNGSNTVNGILQTATSTGGGVTPTSFLGSNRNNSYLDFNITNIRNTGINLIGNGTIRDSNTIISTLVCTNRNTISSVGPTVSTFLAAIGISTVGQKDMTISNTNISMVAGNQSTTRGIYVLNNAGNSIISKNTITDVSVFGGTSTTSSSYGLQTENSTTGTNNIKIFNNFISNIYTSRTTASATRYVFGIFVGVASATSAQSYDVNNNNVSLGQGINTAISSTCFEVQNNGSIYKITNNVFANFTAAQGATAKHFCLRFTGATWGATGSVCNYNDYYVASDLGTSGFISQVNTTNNSTLAAQITAMTSPGSQDVNSITADPIFNNNNTNLHVSSPALNGTGSATAHVTDDIDCMTRTTNDIGADDFDPPACPSPTALTVTGIMPTTATASWTAASPVPSNGYDYVVSTSNALPTGSGTNVMTTTPNLTGLNPNNTTYYLYVRSNCGSSTSSWAGPISFNTAISCSAPDTLSFSNLSTTGFTFAWTPGNLGIPGGYEYIVKTTNTIPTTAGTASTTPSAVISGLTSNTLYYGFVRSICGPNDTSAWSSVLSVFTGYCTPAPSSVDGTGITNVTSGAVNNTTGAESGNYGNYSSLIFDAQRTVSTNVAITYSTGYTYGTKIWIDLNNNLDFTDAGELVYTGLSGAANPFTLNASFTIPISVPLGQYRLRIGGTDADTGPSSPCYTGTFGTFEDYTVNVTIEPSCLAPTSLTNSMVTTTTANHTWTPPTPAPAVGYEWAVTTSATPPASAGTATATTTAASTTLTANTAYYLHVRSDCGTGFSPWATSSSFFTGYCTPAPTSVDGSGITNVNFGNSPNIVNNTTVAEPANYGNYSTLIGDIQAGALDTVNITYQTGYTYDTKIWIDFNNDLDFLDVGENVYTGVSTNANPTTLLASFTIPANTNPGNYRMRIGGQDTGPVLPCYTGTYGTFEDYTVNVTPPPSCVPPTALSVTNIASTSADASWTAPSTGTPTGYKYVLSTTNVTPTIAGTFVATTNASLSGLNENTQYYLFVRTICGTDSSLWSPSLAFKTFCSATNLPYEMPITTVVVPTIPECTQIENIGNLPNTWRSSTINPSIPGWGSSPVVLYPFNATNPANDWLYTRGLNLTGGTSYRLTFKYNNDGSVPADAPDYYPESMKVSYGTSALAASMTTLLEDYPVISNPTPKRDTIDFIPSSSGIFYIGFHAYSAADQDLLILDSIKVDLTPVGCSSVVSATNSLEAATACAIAGMGMVTFDPAITMVTLPDTLVIPANETVTFMGGTGVMIQLNSNNANITTMATSSAIFDMITLKDMATPSISNPVIVNNGNVTLKNAKVVGTSATTEVKVQNNTGSTMVIDGIQSDIKNQE